MTDQTLAWDKSLFRITWSEKSNDVVNIGVYRPRVFNVRYEFTSYLFIIFHVEVKGGIVGVR